ncbi:CaiB/BaiF CoA-transferase family protein, partial [Afifella sp. IM 167]|uniref:CaiB/BaiF CoA transferase family protein n=1 Tax=Afifella sp. IM 167 TaxID=2033586 RepID=UPI001CC9F781
MASEGQLPLTGIKVLDLSHVIAGPFATYQLGLLGAEVTRVERIAGDDFVRTHGGTAAMKEKGLGASFLSQNASKKSVAINLKDPRGSELVLKLAKRADIVMENFRPGVVERLGVGFDAVAAVNPKIVYCSLTGYGPTGPLSGAPAYDHIVQGHSGMMAMTGSPESGPMRVGFPIVDYIAGQSAVIAILAALMQRDRHGAGAQHLTVPMLDSLVSLMGAYAVAHETSGVLRGLQGNEAFSNSPFSGRFDTAGGHIVVTANTVPQARRLCEAIGRADLAAHVDAAAAKGGYGEAETEEIGAALRAAFVSESAEEWEARLTAANVPAAAVRTLAEILAHPQMRENGLMRNLAVPELGMNVQVPGLPFRSGGWGEAALEPAPTLGRDTEAVLEGEGLTEAEIRVLRDEGV